MFMELYREEKREKGDRSGQEDKRGNDVVYMLVGERENRGRIFNKELGCWAG